MKTQIPNVASLSPVRACSDRKVFHALTGAATEDATTVRQPVIRRSGAAGFTLIELIATLVLSGILVAMLLPLIGSSLTGSSRPLLRSPDTYSLRSDMEECWFLYRSFYGDDLPGLADAILELSGNGDFTAANAWVRFDDGVEVATNDEDPNRVLRVTLTNNQGDNLTAYFTPIPQ